MSDFKTIISKLEQFIKKYYSNELLKGIILFFAIGLLYLLFTLFIEYMFWLSPIGRTILFWCFVAVELALFIKFILLPLLQLSKLRKGIDYELASALIGRHFPEVNDKLLNILQLNESPSQSDLLVASIEQKSRELKPVPFASAINFRSNLKYLKYAAIPVLIVFLSWISGRMEWFNDSYERVVNYQTAYEPPAPFQFFVTNENLSTIEGDDFILNVAVAGEIVPEIAEIEFNGQRYFLKTIGGGQFQYKFSRLKSPVEFRFAANEVVSKSYRLNVVQAPSIVNFEMEMDFPNYTKKTTETLRGTGSAVVPEGTKIKWKAKTKSTESLTLLAKDTLMFKRLDDDTFQVEKRVFSNLDYSISTSNSNLQNYENLAFRISTIKDAHPELKVEMRVDSLDAQTLYFYGKASDDYGLTRGQMVYHKSGDESNKKTLPIALSASNFSDFVSVFPNDVDIEAGKSYDIYFEVYDNDELHNFKRTRSATFQYRKRTANEEEQRQLQEQNKTINDISKTLDKFKEQEKKLEEFSKTQKEKNQLNFNDKQRFEEFMRRQKQQEQLMKNFNKKLQDNLEEFQKEKDKKDEFKEELKKRLKENEEQLKKDEDLLKELEEYKDKIDKEDFAQKLEELAKQNKNKKRSMKQLLELTKRFYVMKKAEKLANELDELSKEQQKLSEQNKENTSEAQEKLNKSFEKIQKDLDELDREDRRLQKPMKVPIDEFLEDEIKYDQKEAKEALEKKESGSEEQGGEEMKKALDKAKQKQKQAARKMKEMSEMLSQMMSGGGGGGGQTGEDIEMLRQILENLLLYSFDQEALMDTFEGIDIDNNKYGKYIVEQSNLREHFEHIDDSLFALSMRQPKLSERVNEQITDVYFNIDKALDLLTENRLFQGVAAQQYAITASNELASFLSDVLDNMEMSMNPSAGQGEGGMQLPDIIKSQEEIRQEMESGMQSGKEGEESDKGQKPKSGKEPGEGEKGTEGEQGNEGQEGKQGESGQSGSEGKQGNSGQEGTEGNQGESKAEGSEGKSGKNGNKGNNGDAGGDGDDKRDGYGQGGKEEQNAQLFKIYQKQQQLRQALEDRLEKDGQIQSAGQLIKEMEDIESDLLNYGFTNQTLQKMMDLQHQLLKLENSTFLQGEDSKRQSETNTKDFNENISTKLLNAQNYFNTTEILDRQPLPLQNHVKKKIQDYFNKEND